MKQSVACAPVYRLMALDKISLKKGGGWTAFCVLGRSNLGYELVNPDTRETHVLSVNELHEQHASGNLTREQSYYALSKQRLVAMRSPTSYAHLTENQRTHIEWKWDICERFLDYRASIAFEGRHIDEIVGQIKKDMESQYKPPAKRKKSSGSKEEGGKSFPTGETVMRWLQLLNDMNYDPIGLLDGRHVRRQNIWRNWVLELAECGPLRLIDITRRACGAASAAVRLSFV